MKTLRSALLALVLVWLAVPLATALNPGTDVLVPAAARVGGWVTDLYIMNPGTTGVSVTVQWLERDQANTNPASRQYTALPNQTLVLDDVIRTEFNITQGEGAFRVVAGADVVVNSRIYSLQGFQTFGQGFEGVPSSLAIAAGQSAEVVGLTANSSFRSNIYALAGANGAVLTFSLQTPSGNPIASRQYILGTYQPMLGNILNELGGAQFDNGTLVVTVTSGSAVVGASKVDEATGDPTTLESSWDCGGGGGSPQPAGVYYGAVTQSWGDPPTQRGLTMTVNGNGEVLALRFQMGSNLSGCGFFFNGGGDFDTPVPLASFFEDGGVTFSNSYGGSAAIDWTVELIEGAANQYYSGSLSGVGSGGPGSDACNGNIGDGSVNMGKQPL